MASLAMAASFLGGSTTASTARLSPITARRGGFAAVNATRATAADQSRDIKEEGATSRNYRRDLVLAGVAAAACSIAKMAMAEEKEPERGSPEARKKYAPICVSMPTASICHK